MKKLTRKSLDELAKIYPVLSAQEQRGYVAGTAPTGSVTGVARDCDVGDCPFFHDPNEHYIAPVIITPGGSGSYNGGGSSSGTGVTGSWRDESYGGGGGGDGSGVTGSGSSLLNLLVMDSSKFVGYKIKEPSGCYTRCTEMLGNANVSSAGSDKEITIVDKLNNGTAGATNNSYQNGIQTINNFLQKGQPVIVGVDYKPGSGNVDGMADHFIVIVGMNQNVGANGQIVTNYRFFDPATSQSGKGASSNNVLTVTESGIKGSFTYQTTNGTVTNNYTVTSVRPNQ